MKLKTFIPPLRGITALMASVLALSVVGYGVADTWRDTVDSALGTTSYVVNTDEESATYVTDYSTPEEMMAAAKAHAIKQGEEGTVIMKNDGVLPLKSGATVALFGAAAYKPYMQSSGDLKAGNDDAVNLDDALKAAGFTIDSTMQAIYDEILADYTESTRFGNTTITYNKGYVTSPGDMTTYQVREVPPDLFTQSGYGSAASNWKSQVDADVAICVFARGAGESNTYAPGSALDFYGNATGEDPLALSCDELAVIDAAKETCSKVIVMLNTGNAMEISAIAEGGAHEVDAIAYMGVINDYQCTGIVNVLAGLANSTGALTDTYLVNNESAPAVENFGGDEYADAEVAESAGTDARYPDTNISNGGNSSFGGSSASYGGSQYIVEAEGIYVGYKYYETRYYDSIANPSYKANSTAGSSDGNAWDYNNEVVYSFGHGLSYYEYEQNIKSVTVDKSPEGNITALVTVTNKSDTDGLFLAQLYVQQPYTDYDKTNLVEKAAVNFLNSAKVEVKANSSADVEITIPTKYLASYDYTNAKTYILDEGNYYFTAGAGSHEAVNNILTAQGYTTSDGMDAAGEGATVTWTLDDFDKTTYATDNGTSVTNIVDNADLNYWLPGTVTYLSRQDWEGTYPINYNEDVEIKIASSSKSEEWIKEIRGQQYTIDNSGTTEVENVDGADNGVKFSATQISYEELTNVNAEYWDNLVAEISVNEAIGAIIHGGGQSDALSNIDNPIVSQHEGVNGFVGSEESTDGTTSYSYNINSQTLLGSSFNPELAYEWGLIEGNAGLHLNYQSVWGTGLTLRRTVYNGRNYEYISEDPMLTNRIGYGVITGTLEKGALCGPKHIGFNDQEHNRSGVAVYINEQKFRETDMRGFQGALDDANGLAVMVAFNRIGATNAAHSSAMLTTLLRNEWGFKGLISTDLASSKYYFNAESMIMAGVTQVAEFGNNNSYISSTNDHTASDSKWTYITVDNVKYDTTLVNQARQNLKYQLYAFANSAVLNISTIRVTPWWESAIKTVIVVSSVLTAVAGLGWLVCTLASKKEEE